MGRGGGGGGQGQRRTVSRRERIVQSLKIGERCCQKQKVQLGEE